MSTDAAIALAGATVCQPGVVVLAGTGAMAFGMNEEGEKKRFIPPRFEPAMGAVFLALQDAGVEIKEVMSNTYFSNSGFPILDLTERVVITIEVYNLGVWHTSERRSSRSGATYRNQRSSPARLISIRLRLLNQRSLRSGKNGKLNSLER